LCSQEMDRRVPCGVWCSLFILSIDA
jgi:hypothetical protein